jgi:hypothetical protein
LVARFARTIADSDNRIRLANVRVSSRWPQIKIASVPEIGMASNGAAPACEPIVSGQAMSLAFFAGAEAHEIKLPAKQKTKLGVRNQ